MSTHEQDQQDSARQQASVQVDILNEMVAALGVDYSRLEELRGMDEADRDGNENEELAELEQAAWPCESVEDAEEAIQQDPLEVSVRSGWSSPGETMEPEEFCILLCTGGPAVRIRGELDQYSQPCRAWVEYQDWFTPWTEYHGENLDRDALLTYCQQFYFGG